MAKSIPHDAECRGEFRVTFPRLEVAKKIHWMLIPRAAARFNRLLLFYKIADGSIPRVSHGPCWLFAAKPESRIASVYVDDLVGSAGLEPAASCL